jgi:hypothetical protein
VAALLDNAQRPLSVGDRLSGIAVEHAVRQCEQACRALAAAAIGATQLAGKHPGIDRVVHLAMDCSFFASACARALSRFDRHELETVVFLVDVCRRASDTCASAREHDSTPPPLGTCGAAARTCASACARLLRLLEVEPVVVAQAAARPDASLDGAVSGAGSGGAGEAFVMAPHLAPESK